jgi:hypothetical protein
MSDDEALTPEAHFVFRMFRDDPSIEFELLWAAVARAFPDLNVGEQMDAITEGTEAATEQARKNLAWCEEKRAEGWPDDTPIRLFRGKHHDA